MATYKPVKGPGGTEMRSPDGSLVMRPDRADPTSRQVREVLRRQHMQTTQAQMQRSGEQRPYFRQQAPPPPPPPTPEELAASQTPLPQAAPALPPEVQAGLEAMAPLADVAAKIAGPVPEIGTIDEEIAKATVSTPRNATKQAVEKAKASKGSKKKKKASAQKNIPARECAWEACQKGPGGLPAVFRPYRKYERYCSAECRDLARKKKARDKYQAKKAAKAAAAATRE